MLLLIVASTYLFIKGIGIWGINIPVGWGFDIINFVWWIGIGHAGTLISAILLLLPPDVAHLDQPLRRGDDALRGRLRRPLPAPAHSAGRGSRTGCFPYPNTMGMWPNFRSPLIWDVFAVSTYATVSLLFWFVGLIPDLATLRDRSPSRVGRFIYGMLAMGWRGSARALAPLRDGVPAARRRSRRRWWSRCTPSSASTSPSPSSPAGTRRSSRRTSSPAPIFAGFAMVMTLAIPLRRFYGLEDFITMRHLDNMARIMLATGLIVAYGYMMETFMAWYSGNTYEQLHDQEPLHRPLRAALLGADLLQRRRRSRRSGSSACAQQPAALFVISHLRQRRHVARALHHHRRSACHRDFLPSSWGMYYPTFWDWSTFIGTHRPVPHAALPLHPLPADDLDLRDAHPAARGRRSKERAWHERGRRSTA